MDRNNDTATVNWTQPKATDNSNDVAVILVNTNNRPGSKFHKGSTGVMYYAVDKAGNKSPTCTVVVIVESEYKRQIPQASLKSALMSMVTRMTMKFKILMIIS